MISDHRTSPQNGTNHQPESPPSDNSDPAAEESEGSIQTIVAELLAQGATYLSAKRDLFQLRLRTLAIALAVGLLTLVAAVSVVAAAAVLLVTGMAGGLASALGLPLWAGQLITSTTVAASGTLIIYMALTYLRHSSLQRTMVRYARRDTPNHGASRPKPSPASVRND